MPVLNEDTFTLLSLVERNESLYSECFRIASLALEQHPPVGAVEKGIATVAADARAELTEPLRQVLLFCDDPEVERHLSEARVHWADVAREFLADVLASQRTERSVIRPK